MSGRADRSNACPDCGSSDIGRLSVVEHDVCGAVNFLPEFRSDGRIVCPDCRQACEDELSAVRGGQLYGCRECGHRFDASETTSVSPPPIDGPTHPRWDGVTTDLLSRAADSSTRARTIATVVVLALIVGSAVVTAMGTAPLLEARTDEGEWQTYQSLVVFRNDDVQPYYRIGAMRAVDRVFVEEGVPVTAGVIPAPGNVTLDRGMPVCEYWRGRENQHPELFEYALHGYHHEVVTSFHGGSEFGGVPYERQRTMIERGSRAMEACLGTAPDVFIPPRETYDANTTRALAAEGFVGVSGGNWLTREVFDRTGAFERNGLVHAPSAGGFVKNWSDVRFHDLRTLERRFDRAYENGSLYVQMIHYQYFSNQSRLAVLRGLIEHMKSKGDVGFLTLGEFASKYSAGEIERTDDGWRVRESERGGPTAIESFVDRHLGSAHWSRTPATLER